MDLLRIFGVMRRHWIVTLVGVVLGSVAVLLVSFNVVRDGYTVRLEPSSHTVYSTSVQLLINEPGYGLGSAGLDNMRPDAFDRTLAIAPVYAQLVLSDAVQSEVASRTGGVQELVEAVAVKDAPIVKVTVTGGDPARLVKVATALGLSLGDYLKREQVQNNVPESDRLSVSIMAQPGRPVAKKSRAWEMALIAFLVPVAMAISLAFMLDRHSESTRTAGE